MPHTKPKPPSIRAREMKELMPINMIAPRFPTASQVGAQIRKGMRGKRRPKGGTNTSIRRG